MLAELDLPRTTASHHASGTSGGAAFLSFAPLFLSSAGIPEATIWIASSAVSLALQLGLTIRRSKTVLRDAELRNREFGLILVMYSAEAAFSLLQAINCFWLAMSWPHLATIFWHLIMSLFVFVRLVRPADARRNHLLRETFPPGMFESVVANGKDFF